MADQTDGGTAKTGSESVLRARGRALAAYSAFDSNLDAIRDLAINARAHTKPLDDDKAYFVKLVRRWNAHDSDEAILAVIIRAAELLSDAMKVIHERKDSGEKFNVNSAMYEAMQSSRQEAIETYCSDPSEQLQYRLAIQSVVDRKSRNTVLHSSLLVSAVSGFEVLIGNIARSYLTAFPETMRNSEAAISTEYLSKFESLDSFWAAYRETRVEKLMREDITAWLAWCQRYLKLTPEEISPDHKELTEIFLTRNIHVHNAGKVNDTYLKSCTRCGVAPRQGAAGMKLPVTQSYLVKSIDTLHITGMLVVYGMLKKVADKLDQEDFAGPWLSTNVYSLLEEGRFDAMLALTRLLPELDDSHADIVQVNIWVALKEKDGLDGIRAEIEAWNTDEMQPKFKLVRLALLEDYAAAEAIAEQIFGTEQLSRSDWNSWPVLSGLRAWISADPDRGRFLLGDSQLPAGTPDLGESGAKD